MKKFLILLLTLTLILGVFVSCNSNLPIDDETSEVTKQETTESSQTNQTENIETSDTLTETDETSESEGIEYVESYDFVEIDGQHYMVLNSYNFHPDHYCVVLCGKICITAVSVAKIQRVRIGTCRSYTKSYLRKRLEGCGAEGYIADCGYILLEFKVCLVWSSLVVCLMLREDIAPMKKCIYI